MAEPSNNQTASAAADRLIEAVRDDPALRAELTDRLRDALGFGSQPAAAITEAGKARRLAVTLRKDMREQTRRHKRAKWYTGIVGLFAVMIGGVLFAMVWMMMTDMDRMEAYMYNMGHAARDAKDADRDPRKFQGPSFMLSMARDMQSMNEQMTAMRGDMGQMRSAMLQMDSSMTTMREDIGRMSTDMTTMNASMGRMQYDVLLMRHGVGNMASDTGSMSVPFRAMDQFIPFR
ncbi:hypothetical protein [Thiohalocapsa sp. ML1]|uniref:hypothetical protein n=1 Tax=Thiohalocapsa sp. ML1 TaxID=1431688 RepID=UPI0007323921|nr:hypothetical protein [Thiohalocapsa sp. ML1]